MNTSQRSQCRGSIAASSGRFNGRLPSSTNFRPGLWVRDRLVATERVAEPVDALRPASGNASHPGPNRGKRSVLPRDCIFLPSAARGRRPGPIAGLEAKSFAYLGQVRALRPDDIARQRRNARSPRCAIHISLRLIPTYLAGRTPRSARRPAQRRHPRSEYVTAEPRPFRCTCPVLRASRSVRSDSGPDHERTSGDRLELRYRRRRRFIGQSSRSDA